MKRKIFYAVMLVMAVMMTACSSDDDQELDPTRGQTDDLRGEKTVLIYMAGRNDLTAIVGNDFEEIKAGSRKISEKQNLLVFVRQFGDDGMPWLARIKNGEVTDSVSLKDMGVTSSDGLMRASDPVVMEGVLRYAFKHYPASTGDYGLVLWGHGSGWLMMKEVDMPSTRAYGADYGDDEDCKAANAQWINFPTLAEVLRGMPHLKYIMADCCNFMCLENLYELRNVCDYVIGSPAEIPFEGAPYDQIVPDLFANGQFYSNIIDKYYNSVGGLLPLSVVKTSEMENVAQATRQALLDVKENIGDAYADMTGMIHYYYMDKNTKFRQEYCMFYDAGDFILKHAHEGVYQQWRQALEQAVVDSRMATKWCTDKWWSYVYTDFTVTAEKYHGVSMFVPQDPAKGDYAKYNEDIKQLSWYKVVEQH